MTQACIVEFSPEVLRRLLRLPDGCHITATSQPAELHGVLWVRVEGLGWNVSEGELISKTYPIVTTQIFEDGGEALVTGVDWGCPLPGEAP